MTETNPTPPAWALAYEAWKAQTRYNYTGMQLAFRAGYESASARPAVKIPGVFNLFVNGSCISQHWISERLPYPGERFGYADGNRGPLYICERVDGLRIHIQEVIPRPTDPPLSPRISALAAAPPPPVGDHKALIEALTVALETARKASRRNGDRRTEAAEAPERAAWAAANKVVAEVAAALSQRASGADEGAGG